MPAHTPAVPVAPCRLIAAFLDQKARLLAALCDEGGLFEIRFLRRLLKREHDAVIVASTRAGTIKDRVVALRQRVLRDLASTDNTPGVLDPSEAQEILRDLSTLGTSTRDHATHLEHLT